MKKPELLSPAGDMETLKAAIKNGADAVYLGGQNFGARAFAKNFNNEEIIKAIDLAHLHNVKIYVTVNTLIFEDEIEKLLNYLKFLYENNVDAVIMQDLGMIYLAKKLIPELEIHASTQINAHNQENLKFLKKLGVKRVVLAREMTFEEIKKLPHLTELEVFIHGALCVSYSGNCLFSSLNGGRSGNRGMCTGCCRLPYDLLENGEKINTNGKYLLSTKDLCLANQIPELIKLGIDSLKIEGRMKSKEYVGYITKVYRKLIDNYYNNQNITITKEELTNFKKLYNREFTHGYFLNDNIYNIKTPNHIGFPLGQVIKITKKQIYIKLQDNLTQEDGIKFLNENKGMIVNKLYNEKGLLQKQIKKGNIAIIDNKINLQTKTQVNKTIDITLNKKINERKMPKIPINFKVEAKVNKPLTITISDNKNTITMSSIILDKALNKPTTKEEIKEKLNKINDFPFYLNEISITLEQVFIPMKYLNNLKRDLCQSLMNLKNNKEIHFSYHKEIKHNNDKNQLSILVRNEKQLKTVLKENIRIYTEDYKLYQKYKNSNVYYKLPRIMSNYPNYNNENLLVSEIGSIIKYSKNNNIITDYPLNVTNSETVKLLQKMGAKIVTISPEVKDINLIKQYCNNIETIVYGKLDLMILKDFYNKNNNLSLKNAQGNIFPIINNKYTTILNHQNINIDKITGNIRIILFDENEKQIKQLINTFKGPN